MIMDGVVGAASHTQLADGWPECLYSRRARHPLQSMPGNARPRSFPHLALPRSIGTVEPVAWARERAETVNRPRKVTCLPIAGRTLDELLRNFA